MHTLFFKAVEQRNKQSRKKKTEVLTLDEQEDDWKELVRLQLARMQLQQAELADHEERLVDAAKEHQPSSRHLAYCLRLGRRLDDDEHPNRDYISHNSK